MATHSRLELSVGAFVVAGLAVIVYLAVSLGDVRVFEGDRKTLVARFASVGDLRVSAPIRIAGVSVGRVGKIRLVGYVAQIELSITADVEIPADTIASIRTAGLLGEAFVSLSPGGSNRMLRDGDTIARTEPALDLTQLLQKYAFGSNPTASDGGATPHVEDPLR